MTDQPDRLSAWAAQQAAEWFVENRSGALSASRKREFIRWLGACPLHIKEYLAIARTAVDVAAFAECVDTPLAELLAAAASEERVVPLTAQGSAERNDAVSSHRSLPRVVQWRPAAALTAGIAASLALAIAGWLWVQHPQMGQYRDVQYVAPPGQDLTVKLADDTAMYLTIDSAVRVRFDAHRRLIEVDRGQALFEVAHDATRPFEVHAGNTVIEDVGTVFDVSRESQQTVVTVLEGQVSLWGLPPSSGKPSRQSSGDNSTSASGNPPRTHLGAGEQASILPTGVVTTRRPRDLTHAAPWFKPQIVFDGETLADVAAEFNRHNREQIEIRDPRVGALPLSGVFHSYDIASFASFLNSLHGVHAVMANGHLEVRATADPNASITP
jgi:transmembrane sensor